MRSHVKKKMYNLHKKDNICAGLISDARTGGWNKETLSGSDLKRSEMQINGARENKKSRDKRPFKGGKVHWTNKSGSKMLRNAIQKAA